MSSAYIRGCEYDRQFGKSFMYNKNNSDPRIVPWGMPQVNERFSDLLMKENTFDYDRSSKT